MKNAILVAVMALVGFSASAQTETIVAQLQGVDNTVKSIELTEAGLLKIQKADNTITSQQLSAVNAGRLVYEAKELATAELVTDYRQFVCMMFVPAQNLMVNASGSLKLVLSANSCATHEYTHPKDANYLAMAQNLKSELIVLAEEQ